YEEVNPARGYLSCMPAELHFGMGKAEAADSVVIVWPGGLRQKLAGVKLNQKLVVKESPSQELRRPMGSAGGTTVGEVNKVTGPTIFHKGPGFFFIKT